MTHNEPSLDVTPVVTDDGQATMNEADPWAARRRARVRASVTGRPAWDKEHTRELFARYRAGDESARQELVVNHLNLVRFLAGKYKNRGEPMDDLIQVGTIGLIKAIDRFDPDRGSEFTSFATPNIMGEIKRHFRDKGWSVRVPRRLQELSQKVNAATEELTRDLQRPPSVEEIAKRVGASVDDVLESMESSSAYSAVSLESAQGEGDDATPLIDRYVSFDEDLIASDDRMMLDQIMEGFSPRERELIDMRYKEELTQAKIAERLGISQVQVSRLLQRTTKRIREKIGDSKPPAAEE